MTYRELLAALYYMTDDQLDSDVTMHLTALFDDEYVPAELKFVEDSDVLDAGHPVLTCTY